ncbi:MAG: hypothetical protein KMY53_06130 [Desulfarculus sp.]|nr:hypothetical protein [Pseudomonadota bacterium]MBU4596363.1 hypothetical protein [Pseudomonadota bacterium]MBV1717075.1 hypothetical protein [Desulfarculus sp.]MBV1737722.1 hypothetical protein [Desulfarculus sp.]
MPARAGKIALLLLGALLLALAPTLAAAKGLRVELKLVFADGAQLVQASSGDLRLERPGAKDQAEPGESLSPDKEGLVRLSLFRPGGYRLKLMGIPVAQFSVEETKQGLQARSLPTVLKLPFTHVLELRPPSRREKYTDLKTGRERSRTVYESIDWSQVKVGAPGENKLLKLWPYRFSNYAAAIDDRQGPAVAATAPGCAPRVAALRRPKPEHAGRLNNRKVAINFVRVSYHRGDPDKSQGVPKAAVHNVEKKVLWWLGGVSVDRENRWYLLSYSLEKKTGAVTLLKLSSAARRVGSPSLYLDEGGAVNIYRRAKGPDGKEHGQCYRIEAGGVGVAKPDCVYPNFRFHGQVYGKGGRWFMPNIGGVPLAVGSNSISVSGTVRVGNRTTSASESYRIDVEGPVPHVVGDIPGTTCTGSIPNAHDDDNRLCLDPPVDPNFYKGPAPKAEDACPKPKAGCRGDKGCIERLRVCMERFNKSLAAWQRYRPKPPCYGDMIKGKATFGGISLTYAGPVELMVPTDFGPQGQPLKSVKRTEIMSGLPPLNRDNYLVDSSMGWGSLQEPLNLREGPYRELRYMAKRIDPVTRKQSQRYEVVTLYPWNYSVTTEGREIKVDRSGILRPGPPPAKEKADAGTGAYFEVVSPNPEGRHALTGPEAEVRIRLRYQLAGAPSGTLKISADHADGLLYKQSVALPGPGGERRIAFKVSQPAGSPQFGVGLELVPAGAQSGPTERIYYHFSAGAFGVEAQTEKPVAAHPKNLAQVTLTIKSPDGKPLANRQFDVELPARKETWLRGGYLHHQGGASVRVTTDAAGQATVLYIPPQADMSAQGAPLGNFPVWEQLKISDVADREQNATAELELVSPWPRISKLVLPGGDLAGHWQGEDSRVVVADADSSTFDITIYGPGEFGYSGGHGRQEKLEVLDAASPFRFRFKSRPMGLDLNDIPSNWDMVKDFGATNAKVLGRIALLMGGNWLLKQHAVTGTAKTVTHTSQVTKTIGGTSKVSSIGGRLGSDIDTTIVTKVKIMTTFENALPEATWATGLMGDADAVISMTKNTAEVMNTAGQSYTDATAAKGTGLVYNADAALDGMHAGVGIVDTIVTFKDMITNSPMSLKTELIKGVYENAKMLYNWNLQFQKVAYAQEMATYLPILVEVTDREGHRARRLGRLVINYHVEAMD